jgi:amidase
MLNRRNFILNSALASASFVIPAIISCNNKSDPKGKLEEGNQKFELSEMTIDQLSEKLKKGEYTAKRLVELYLKRIEEIDKAGPTLNSVIELNPDALKIAESLDNERNSGKIRGPLHGIPVMIKDNIDTADQMSTTAGSLALEGNKAATDAFIVKQLRDAGAIIIGKTNLSEWANFRSSRSSSGWSSRGGQTKNPYILSRNPCGSSSGSGVAVSANLCAIAIGTETDGSIVCPSAMNGITGIKPTVGLLSRSGIIPISKTQDTAGPMARTLKDAAIVLGLLTSVDTNDDAMNDPRRKAFSDYTVFLKTDGLKGKRIGVEKSFLHGHEGINKLILEAIEVMKRHGAEVVEVAVMTKINELGANELKVMEYEFKEGINKYLAQANGKVKSLKELIEFNKQNADKIMPYFQQELLDSTEAKSGLESKEYKDAVSKNLKASRDIIDSILIENKIAAICGPTYGPSWCTDLVNGDHFTGYGLSTPAAISGYPNINVPLGFVQGLPIGISFFGTAYAEAGLIEIAYAFEQATKQRKEPEFKAG